MAGSAEGIRAGRAFVEIGGTDVPLRKVLLSSSRLVQGFSRTVTGIGLGLSVVGRNLARFGAAAGTPLAAAVRSFSSLEAALADLRANARPTAEEFQRIQTSIDDISKQTGKGPTEVAAAMSNLLKAGLPLATVMGDATKATLEFAKVAQMDAASASVVLADAMNVFGVDARTAADAISKAADASSISVEDVAESFGQASTVASQAGLSIHETANAIALLGSAGIKGSDAGTSLRTMMLRLTTGAEKAGKTMKALGINVRKPNGQMKSMRDIIAALQKGLGKLHGQALSKAMYDLFGSDAIRSGTVFLRKGVKGWDQFAQAIQDSLPVGQKAAILLDTLAGLAEKAMAAIERLGAKIGMSLAPALGKLGIEFGAVLDGLGRIAQANPEVIQGWAKLAVGAVAAGGALVVVGTSLSTLGGAVATGLTALGGLASTLAFLATPMGIVSTGIAAIGATLAAGAGYWLVYSGNAQAALESAMGVATEMKDVAVTAFGAIVDALKEGDLGKATAIFWAAAKVEWLTGVNFIMAKWEDLKVFLKNTYEGIGFELQKAFINAFAAVETEWATFVSNLTSNWHSAIATMADVAMKILDPIGAILDAISGTDTASAVRDVLGQTALGETADEKSRREADLAAERGRIEQQRQRDIGGVDDAQRNQQGLNRGAGDAETARRRRELNQARAELADLVRPTPIMESDGAPKGGPPAARIPAEDAAEASEGTARALRKVDVSGTFNAATAGRLSAGNSVNSLLEQQIKESEKQTRELEKLNRKASEGGLVFGP